MTTYAYNNSANGATSVTATRVNIWSSAGNDDLHGVDFLDLSDATAGVALDLAEEPMTLSEDGLGSDTIEGFEALILSAFADIVDANALDRIIRGGINKAPVFEWNATWNAYTFDHYA